VKKGPEPTVVTWQNLQVGKFSRCVRTTIVTLITVVLLAASIMGIVVSKYYQDTNSEKYNTSNCGISTETLTMDQAFNDYNLPPERQAGLINCFCFNQLKILGYIHLCLSYYIGSTQQI